MTTKRERFLAAAHGQQTDRPPVGAWIHYGSSFWTPEQVAEAHLRFYHQYDWDYIKVMDDFRLQVPDGLDGIGVHYAPGGLDHCGYFRDREGDAGFVVGPHDAHKRRPLPQRALKAGKVELSR